MKNFETEGSVLYSGRNTIKLINIDGKDVVVKRFKKPSFFQKIVYTFFRKNKAYRSYYNAIALQGRGVDTPKPIKYIETKKCGLTDYCYYISEYLPLPPMEDWSDRDDWDKDLAVQFARFVAYLHTQGILHHDLNDTNVRYDPSLLDSLETVHYPLPIDETSFSNRNYSLLLKHVPLFTLIDINRMDFYPTGTEVPFKKGLDNLTRFTGRMDLFEFVVREYARVLRLPIEETVEQAIRIKKKHDKNWVRRKRFTGFFKQLFKSKSAKS